jgi:2-polyprenyl-3-methyl-5-hydroxy-6-metoxy-1,4-benzoquinol methylase
VAAEARPVTGCAALQHDGRAPLCRPKDGGKGLLSGPQDHPRSEVCSPMQNSVASEEALKAEIIRLGPWHIDVEVTPQLTTAAFLEAPEDLYTGHKDLNRVSFLSPRKGWVEMMKNIYPEGLADRSFLDCACNCGAYTFWAKELGAGRTHGFDVRDHWIDQAKFLLANRTVGPKDRMSFATRDVYDLPKAGLEPFDIVMFQGIFYHLPDPITALKGAADLCKEVILLDTAIRTDLPDNCMVIAEEGREQVMTGVYGLNWFPTGPKVLERILRWLGFVDVRVIYWRKKRTTRLGRSGFGRIRLVGSRTKGMLDALPEKTEPDEIETDKVRFRGKFDAEAIKASALRNTKS